MAVPKAIRRAAMIPSRTTFHNAVGEATDVMQRRMVAVPATRAALPNVGKPFAIAKPLCYSKFGTEGNYGSGFHNQGTSALYPKDGMGRGCCDPRFMPRLYLDNNDVLGCITGIPR